MALSNEIQTFLDSTNAVLPQMSERDRSFVSSVIFTVTQKKRMSDRQREVIQNAVNRALNPAPAPTTETVGEMSAVIALFDKAKQKLKYPSIVLQTRSGQKVEISVAGDRAKVPGSLTVTDGGSYGTTSGSGVSRGKGSGAAPRPRGDIAGVREVLHDLAMDPAGTAARYGRLTGRCCFCNKGLEDERSLAVGYGSTCAKNYQLPWGVQAAREAGSILDDLDMKRMEAMADVSRPSAKKRTSGPDAGRSNW